MGASILDWMTDHVFPWILIGTFVLMGLFLLCLPFAIYEMATAEKFELRKDEWICANSVERANTTYIQSGNIMVPMTTYSKHCTQWNEKP